MAENQDYSDDHFQPGKNIEDVADAKELWQGGFSGKSMIGSWLAAAAASILILVIILQIEALRNNAIAWYVAIGLIVIIWGYLLGLMLYRKWGKHYELTTQQLKHREGILFRKLDRIELIDIDDVNYQQGPIQTLLGVGNINIKSSDTSHPELVLYGIANIKQVSDMIDNARRNERRKRGLHIESI
jgi:membrane protein YdbS with pleckstrin-like domain